MFIYLVLANEDSPYLFGVYANEKEAVKEKNILKHANSDVKVKRIQCNTVPDYVYTIDLNLLFSSVLHFVFIFKMSM